MLLPASRMSSCCRSCCRSKLLSELFLLKADVKAATVRLASKAVRVALLRQQRGWKARRLDEPGYSKAVAVASRERE